MNSQASMAFLNDKCKPSVLHYFETFEVRADAIRRELFFKSIDGYNFLKSQNIIWEIFPQQYFAD